MPAVAPVTKAVGMGCTLRDGSGRTSPPSAPFAGYRAPVPVPRLPRSFGGTWLLFGGLFALLTVLWSLATPLPSGPDEPAQYVRAASVASGVLTGEHPPRTPAFAVVVHIPAQLRFMGAGRGCYYGPPSRGAGCATPPAQQEEGTVRAVTYVGYYPPLYYALTGWPSRFSTSRVGLRAMRLTSAVLGALLLGLAVATARRWSRNPWLLVGLGL